MAPRPSWQRKKKPRHRMENHRHPKRRGVVPTGGRLTLWLWSLSGEKVATYDASGSVAETPAFCMHEGVRYGKVERQGGNIRVVHYQTHTIVRRAVA